MIIPNLMYNVNEIIKFTPFPALIPSGHNVIAKLKQTELKYETWKIFEKVLFINPAIK